MTTPRRVMSHLHFAYKNGVAEATPLQRVKKASQSLPTEVGK